MCSSDLERATVSLPAPAPAVEQPQAAAPGEQSDPAPFDPYTVTTDQMDARKWDATSEVWKLAAKIEKMAKRSGVTWTATQAIKHAAEDVYSTCLGLIEADAPCIHHAMIDRLKEQASRLEKHG